MKHPHITQNFINAINISGRKIQAYKMVFEKNGKQMETADYTDRTLLNEIRNAAEKFGYKYIKTITV